MGKHIARLNFHLLLALRSQSIEVSSRCWCLLICFGLKACKRLLQEPNSFWWHVDRNSVVVPADAASPRGDGQAQAAVSPIILPMLLGPTIRPRTGMWAPFLNESSDA